MKPDSSEAKGDFGHQKRAFDVNAEEALQIVERSFLDIADQAVTSQTMTVAPGSAEALASNRGLSILRIMTEAPARVKARAVASPIPLDPPVIRANRLSRRKGDFIPLIVAFSPEKYGFPLLLRDRTSGTAATNALAKMSRF
jgi:hypothetical protein